jgi:hypothetical protein
LADDGTDEEGRERDELEDVRTYIRARVLVWPDRREARAPKPEAPQFFPLTGTVPRLRRSIMDDFWPKHRFTKFVVRVSLIDEVDSLEYSAPKRDRTVTITEEGDLALAGEIHDVLVVPY